MNPPPRSNCECPKLVLQLFSSRGHCTWEQRGGRGWWSSLPCSRYLSSRTGQWSLHPCFCCSTGEWISSSPIPPSRHSPYNASHTLVIGIPREALLEWWWTRPPVCATSTPPFRAPPSHMYSQLNHNWCFRPVGLVWKNYNMIPGQFKILFWSDLVT